MSPGSPARGDRWSAAGLAVLALAYLAVNRGHPLDTLAAPGPGVFPLLAGVALLLVAIWQLVGPAGPAPPPAEASPARPARRRHGIPLAMIGVLVAYTASLGALGFLAASAALVVVTARLMGARGWWQPTVLALAVVAAIHLVFAVWLGVRLPAGPFR
jgi:putative tricarboxylic transport membrane protein